MLRTFRAKGTLLFKFPQENIKLITLRDYFCKYFIVKIFLRIFLKIYNRLSETFLRSIHSSRYALMYANQQLVNTFRQCTATSQLTSYSSVTNNYLNVS